ncbi:outer membrane protein assembly factor BamA [Phenylobacterium sp.]|jgi:outer membrane protein insertion porin family|uniref:outer membrane protein assembly factor BamA n=1 Tax=Phenylobacterium sp. TaxID=1871053 RepID=UPI002E33CD17|nr:outer membrane protein assembly factor BamA [Phenylobacterium sp.]HEX4711274.1 outer membrane protein assembly factor BamA [Phenylobacterium sp.]
MYRHRARSAALVSGLAGLLATTALASPRLAFAQVPAPPSAAPAAPAAPSPPAAGAPTPTAPAPAPPASTVPTGVVQRILVRGNERIEPTTVISYLPISVGETIDPAKIDAGLKALFRTDLFSDVKMDFNNGDLIVTVVENPIINRVLFEGNSSIKEDKLKDEVTVRPRGIFTRAKAQQDVGRIVELYRRAGRISATVTPQIVELPQKRVDLIFKIDEGPKSGVLRVNFMGNKAFSDDDLRNVVVTEQSHWYKFFSSNANYDPDRLEYDKEQLRKYYRNRGFYDFRVSSAVAELASDKNGFVVTYTIDEGPEYKFGKISVDTDLKKLDKNVLLALVPFRRGDVYQDEKIEQATDALTFAAGAAGFAFVDVRPRYVPDRAKGTVDVNFDIKEGPRVYIDRIDIVGNTRTLDYVIRRQMNVSEGDAYNRVLVDRSKSQVRSLGFFKNVDITEIPGTAPDRTGLLVKVEEQPTGELSFSAGYSSVDQLVVDLGITERNFRGRGEDVRARISLGSLRQQVDFSFTEPRFLDRNLAAGIDTYYYKYDLSQYQAYTQQTVGMGLRMSFPLSLNSTGTLRYTLRSDNVQIDPSFCDPTSLVVSVSLCDQRGTFLTSAVGYGYRLDKRNDAINPTRGFFVEMNQDFAGLGGDVRYIKTEADGGWYYGFNKTYNLSLLGSAGIIEGWGGDHVRINDRFYKGGASFRGFQTAGIGPRDLNFASTGQADALGGDVYAIGTVELTVPTFLPEQYGIKAALFSDFGTLGSLDNVDKSKIDPTTGATVIDPLIKDDLGLRASAGLSIFWKSPMGPIRFDLSQILKREYYDRTETFRFSTSTRF